MAIEDRSKWMAPPLTHNTPNAPLLPPRGLFSFRPSAPRAAADDRGGEMSGTVDRGLIKARIRKQQSIFRDQLSEMMQASHSTALTINTAAANIPASAGQQSTSSSSSSSSSMSETSPSESQVSICTTVSTTTTSPSSDSGMSGIDKSVLPSAFDRSAGFSLAEEKGKHSSESEYEAERHHIHKHGYRGGKVDRYGRFRDNEDSFSEASQPCSESTRGSIEDRPRGVRQVLRKVSASVKKKLHRLWPEEDDEHAQLRWVHMPVDEPDNSNPFYQVRYGVQFQSLVPQPPARFPYAPQIAYSSRYGSAVTIDPSDRADLKEEERQRERQNRRALLRRRSTAGRFRRRPNITLPPTEGRITEPVEVARIRRAYGGTPISKTQQRNEDRDRDKDQDHDSLLERMNRQVRTGTQEWTLTGVQQQQTQPSASTALPGNITRVAVSDANQRIVSRRSLNRTVSTRAQGRPVRREDLHRSQSSFRTQWEAYQRQKMVTGRDSSALASGSRSQVVECNTGFVQDLTARLEQVAATDQRAEAWNEVPVPVPVPVLMITPCPGPVSDTTPHGGRSSSSLASQITEPTSTYLTAPLARSRGEGVERRPRRGPSSLSPYASDIEVEGDHVSVRVRSSRSSVYSASSRVSAASSIANSIYSALSEDWIRPPYYAKPKSARYPLSLQQSIRTLPPHIMIGVRRTAHVHSDVKTVAEATRLAKQMRTRGLRDQNGDMIRPDVGDQLHTVEFTMVFKPIEESVIAQEEKQSQPTLLFRVPCKSAFPVAADSMGFVEYSSDDEDAEFSRDGSGRVTAVDVGEGERRAVLDVNDTSAMVAMGINPLDSHPNPLAFYNTHFAYFQEHGHFLEDTVWNAPPFSSANIEDSWSAQESNGGEQDIQESEPKEIRSGKGLEHAKPTIGDATMPPSSPDLPAQEASPRSKTVFKKAYARVRSFWFNGDPPTASTTAMPLATDRFQ
ncbi:hypothetical protein BGZ70_001303, partial [Mortierella alpina]